MLINSPEALLTHLLEGSFDLDNAILGDGFKAVFKISGPAWDGKLDYRVAQIILSAQRDFLAILSTVTDKKYSLSSKEIKNLQLRLPININKGSLEVSIDYTQIIIEALKMLPVNSLFIVFGFAIAGVFGYYSLKNANETKKYISDNALQTEEAKIKLQEALSHENVRVEELKTIDHVLDFSGKHISGFRQIVGYMKDGDTLTYNEEDYTKEEILDILPPMVQEKPVIDTTPKWADDNFIVDVWDLKNSQLTIYDEAKTQLKPKINFLKAADNERFKTCLSNPGSNEASQIRLRVGVTFSADGRIIDSFIVQIDPPDNEFPTLADLMSAV